MTKGDVSEYGNLFSKNKFKKEKSSASPIWCYAAFKYMLTSFRHIIYCQQ